MTTIKLPVLGIDMMSDETQLPAGTVRAAVNVDIDRDGVPRRRSGFQLQPGHTKELTGIESFGGKLYVGYAQNLAVFDPTTGATTPVAYMGAGLLDFTQYAGSLYVTSPQHLRRIGADGSVHDVGVRPLSLPEMSVHTYGQFAPGTYTVAVSLVAPNGEESAAHKLGSIRLAGGLRLFNVPVQMGYSWRVYMTPPDGDVLYLADEFPALLGEQVIGNSMNGAQCQTLNLQPMPAGEFVRGRAGRLYVARGDTLWFSEPMRPHLMAARRNFIRFIGRIRFVEVLEGGAYVGDDNGVHWLAGDDPTKWAMTDATPVLALRRSSMLVAGNLLAGSKENDDCAVWLSAEGYFMGTPSGSVSMLQPGRIRVDPASEGRSVLLTRDGVTQVITLTAAPSATVFGVAIDSATIQ